MQNFVSGKAYDIVCQERSLPEFPEMLFGVSNDNGLMYFNASAYLVSDRKCEFKDVWAETQADAMNKLYGTIPPDTQIRTIREA